MIEVPPPSAPEAKYLREGTMTRNEYIWHKGWYSFFCGGWSFGFAIFEFTIGHPYSNVLGAVLMLSAVVQVVLALRWRKYHTFWQQWAERWLDQQEQWGHLMRRMVK